MAPCSSILASGPKNLLRLGIVGISFHASSATRATLATARDAVNSPDHPAAAMLLELATRFQCLVKGGLASANADGDTPINHSTIFLAFWLPALAIYVVALLATYISWQHLDHAEQTRRTIAGLQSVWDANQQTTSMLRFRHEKMEKMWLRESEGTLRTNGAKMLCLVSSGLLAFCVIRLVEMPDCAHISVANQVLSIGFQALGCLFMFALSWRLTWMSVDHAGLYWGIVAIYFFCIPALNCPPVTPTCKSLIDQCGGALREFGRAKRYVRQSIEFSDCSLQGITSTMMLMTWILALPWVLPRYPMMQLVWIWLVGAYLGWTVVYHCVYSPPDPHALEQHRLVMADMGRPVDVSMRMLILCVSLMMSMGKKFYLEKAERNRFASGLKHLAATKRIYNILKFMVPPHVIVPMLQRPGSTIAEQIECVSILFCEIVNFDDVARDVQPRELLNFLNDIFNQFDDICARRGVSKIETWCHEYVCCVGTSLSDSHLTSVHGHAVLLEQLLRAGAEMLELQTEKVKFKMGVHTGPIVAGVIGAKLPRYRLFGDTINTAARQMQRSVPGQLQFGAETQKCLPTCLKATFRGKVLMKGKGEVDAFCLDLASLVEAGESGGCERQTFRAVATKAKRGLAVKLCQSEERRKVDEGSMARIQSSDGFEDLHHIFTGDDDEDEEEEEEDRELKEVLRKVASQGGEDKIRWILSQRAGFTPEMEAEWFQRYHEEAICKKLVIRMGRQTLALTVSTVLECAFLGYVRLWTGRFQMYLGCKAGALLITMYWWHIAGATSWIQKNAHASQVSLLASCCVVGVLIGLAYEALTDSLHAEFSHDHNLSKEMIAVDQFFALLYALIYHMIARSHKFRFLPSLMFPFLAANFLVIESHTEDHTLFPFQGKLFFFFNSVLCTVLAHEEEQESRARFKANHARQVTQDRSTIILGTLMPPFVVQELRELGPNELLPIHQYRHATIAQSDLCGFTNLASTKTPQQVVNLVSDLFGRFDVASDRRGIYKVETVGDAYIAGMAESPLTIANSPASVLLFGLDMIKAVREWSHDLGAGVTCRVGVHYGECIGGIVGNDSQRYHIFGDLMNYIEILESTGVESRVQISKACKEEVDRQIAQDGPQENDIGFELRTDVEHLQTSKGEIHYFADVGGRTYLVHFG